MLSDIMISGANRITKFRDPDFFPKSDLDFGRKSGSLLRTLSEKSRQVFDKILFMSVTG